MPTLIPVLLINANSLDRLPEDIRTRAIALSNLFLEKGIYPLLESKVDKFDTNFVNSGRYLSYCMVQIKHDYLRTSLSEGRHFI